MVGSKSPITGERRYCPWDVKLTTIGDMAVNNPEAPSPLLLVVEDHPSLRDVMAEVLHYAGYQTALAASGREALRLLDAVPHEPHLIISDIVMPEMDGYQLMRAVRANEAWRGIPFLFVSGQEETRVLVDPSAVGAARKVGYLSRPFGGPALVEMIERMLHEPIE